MIIVLWIYQKAYAQTWRLVRQSNVLMAVGIFILLHVVGLLWTEDLSWGLHMLGKEWKFLLMPIFMYFVKKEHIRYYVSAFLIAMSISELLSYLIWFEIIPPIHKATLYDPTPFMHHTSYNPFLALAIYFVGNYLLFDQTFTRPQKLLIGLFFITMSINMFITGGRAGQVGYIVILIILLFQFYHKNMLKALFLSLFFALTTFFVAYQSSTIFHDRMNLVVQDIKHFDENKNTSVALRLNFALNTFRMIQQNPLFGVGTGDYKKSYKKINCTFSPSVLCTTQPHNMYLLEMAILGIFGLLSLLYILYAQITFSQKESCSFKGKAGLALPVLFFVLMFSDAYLLGHYTTMLFIYFSAFLYKPSDAQHA